MEEDQNGKYPALPSNYVTLLQLQERWLKEKERKRKEEEQLEQQQQQEQELQQPRHKEFRQQVVQRTKINSKYRNRNWNWKLRRNDGDVSRTTHEWSCKKSEELVDTGNEISEKEQSLGLKKKKNNMNGKTKKKQEEGMQKNPRAEMKPTEGTEHAPEVSNEDVIKGKEHYQDDGDVSQTTPEWSCKKSEELVDTGNEISEKKQGLGLKKKKKNMNGKTKKKQEEEGMQENPRAEMKPTKGTEHAPEVSNEVVTKGKEHSQDEKSQTENARARIVDAKEKRVKYWRRIDIVDQTVQIEQRFRHISVNGGTGRGTNRWMIRNRGSNKGDRDFRNYGRFECRGTRNPQDAGMVWMRKGEFSTGVVHGIESKIAVAKGLDYTDAIPG